MRAAILREHGAVPEIAEHPDPTGPGVVDLVVAGMNPVDTRIATGTFPLERHEPPYIAGKEGVGRREDGSLVYFEYSEKPFGAFAERTRLEPGQGYPVPDGLDPALAVCLGVSGLAAWLGLEWRGRLAAGETVLVLGASGVVGQIAVQAAKLLGAGRVVAAARNPEWLERLPGLGADATVSLADEAGRAEALKAAAGDGGYDVVLDPLWGAPAVAAIGAMARFGRLVALGQAAGAEATIPSAAVRGKPVDLLGYTNYTAGEERKAAAYAALAAHAAAGRIRVEIERYGLDDVPRVWERQTTSPNAKQVILF
ncbi:MAG TPA: zinc-binding dehydrogenase [Solirubrobacteraceae bacterium]|jgi:NADPH:quinone reductase-like Zn-dependent oxidoreductase|nr:zinc-binding dehydrogenase [Solirubrobacteraceae bacterium]